MLYRQLLFICLLFIPAYAFSANFYKCENSVGKVTFSDKPCPAKSKTTKKGKLNSFRISGTVGNGEFPDDKPDRDANAVFIFRAKFSNILQSLSPLRVSITQFYMERGQWPENMEALGFERQAMQSQHIDSVRIKKNGKVVAMLNAKLGEHKMIILNPKPAMGATTIDWQCWSNYPRTLLGGGELEICGSREIY
jgi:hypothetical protein